MRYTKPNLEEEWMEALRYREFEKMGKKGWIKFASQNYSITNFEKIEDVLNNIDLDYDSLDEDKKKRFEEAFENGEVEIPIVVKFSNNDYDLLGGNTRVAGLIKNGVNPKLYVIDMTKRGGNGSSNMMKIEENDEETHEHDDDMVTGVAEILKQIEDIDNRKSVFDNMIEKFDKENVNYDEEEFSKMSGLKSEKGDREMDEDCWKGYKQVGGKIKNGKNVPNCVPKNESEGDTNEASSPAQQAAIAINMKKKGVKPKGETKEQTDAGSSGAFVGPLSGGPVKKDINEVVDASASGEYDVPAFGKTSRGGRKDPLKIDGPESIGKTRAVKDKNFPKFGGPGGVFIKIKDKCKKFPYCNQGDINAIEVLRESIEEISKKTGVPYKEIEIIVLNEIKQIFI